MVLKVWKMTRKSRKIKGAPNNTIFKIGQDTQKSPADLRRLATIQILAANLGEKN